MTQRAGKQSRENNSITGSVGCTWASSSNADWLTSVFYRLSGSEQDEVTSALANAGSGSNQSVSVAALRSLIRLSDEKLVNLRP